MGVNGLRRKNETAKRIVTAETFGMVLVLFSLLTFIVVLTGEGLLGSFGANVRAFLYGAFGYTVFAVLCALFYTGILLVSGKRPRVELALGFTLFIGILSLLACLHVILTLDFPATSFLGYVKACYAMGEGSFAGVTVGGALIAMLCYPVISLISAVGAAIVFGFITLLCVYSVYVRITNGPTEKQKKKSAPKGKGDVYRETPKEISGVKAYPVTNFDFEAEENRQNVQSNTERYFGNAVFELKTTKEMKKGDSRSESLKILYPNRGKEQLDFSQGGQDLENYRKDYAQKLNYITTPPPVIPQPFQSSATPLKTVPGSGTSRFTDGEGVTYAQPAPTPIAPIRESYRTVETFTEPERDNYRTFESFTEPVRNSYKTEEPLETNFIQPEPTHVPSQEEFPYARQNTVSSAPSYGVDFSRINPTRQEEFSRDIPVDNISYNPRPVEPGLEESEETPFIPESGFNGEESFAARREMQTPITPVEPMRTTVRMPYANESAPERAQPIPKEPVTPPMDEMPLVYHYVAPPVDMLRDYAIKAENFAAENEERSHIIEETLMGFKIPATVVHVTNGAAFSRFELSLPPSISVKKIPQYEDDIAMRVQAKDGVRVEAPIPGKDLVGVEIANRSRYTVGMKPVMQDSVFRNSKAGSLTFALGQDISGENVVCDITKMPHMLVAGSTGTGKSVCLTTMILSLIMKYSPEDLRLVLIDPKTVEFTMFRKIPHLLLPDPVTDVNKAIKIFGWAVEEMERRFMTFSEAEVRNLEEYNASRKPNQRKLPKIVIIVDELNDLMMRNKKAMEDGIVKIAQKARAAGIHLILATQRPSVDVITGIIKANLPARISFRVTNAADSITILNEGGAEKLLGMGDLLFSDGVRQNPLRLQGVFADTEEVKTIVGFIRERNKAYYSKEVEEMLNRPERQEEDVQERGVGGGRGSVDQDPLFIDALREVVRAQSASTSMLQRKLRIGFARAGSIIDEMTEKGFISAFEGNRTRKVLMTYDEFVEKYENGEE
ncbi:MAG: DNA translocase FtsK [Clostridiales bacterium]|nr:DNA translocase FtsK [Clostridiales bacterium]